MQTQCPHCDTQFRITETQVSTADGFVRCGVCQEVFNAYDVASEQEQQPSLLDDQTTLNTPVKIPAEIPVDALLEITSKQDQQRHSATADNNDAFDSNTLATDSETDYHSGRNPDKSKDEFDFFDEAALPSQQNVVPDILRNTTSPTTLSTVLWSAGILMLIASLFIEYTWFNRHQLNQLPELQAWISKLCRQVDCSQITVRDPKNIELITRNVYSHPTDKKALMINITIKNNAKFAQPYPLLQIDFSDIRGGLMASRKFLPDEYLPSEAINPTPSITSLTPADIIQAGSSLSFTMEIVDPGKQAKTYEFNSL